MTEEKKKPGRKKAETKPSDSTPAVVKAEVVTTEAPKEVSTRARRAQPTAEFQESVRDQIDNCRAEIVSEIQTSIQHEVGDVLIRQTQRERRKRRLGNFWRDLLILLLLAAVGYAAYCLYDAKYFDFLKPECERNGTCVEEKPETIQPEETRDTAWYIERYGKLFDDVQLNLDPNSLDAYYLYNNDHRANELLPAYALGIAYNRANSTVDERSNTVVVTEAEMRRAFQDMFGSLDGYVTESFTNGCLNFSYDRNGGRFIAERRECNYNNSNRSIVEKIDKMYEEGNALYVLTTAAIYDKLARSFYRFSDPFQAAVVNVDPDDLQQNSVNLNQYQYQFKKTDGKYYLDAIIKLR